MARNRDFRLPGFPGLPLYIRPYLELDIASCLDEVPGLTLDFVESLLGLVWGPINLDFVIVTEGNVNLKRKIVQLPFS